MAGDWIKMRTDLWTDPRIVRIACGQDADLCAVIGAIYRLWSLADTHSEDGTLTGYTPEWLDQEVGIPGFAQQLADVGWLTISDKSLSIPNFDEHNGQSAKRRAKDTSRKGRVRKMSASKADKVRNREEGEGEKSIPYQKGEEGEENAPTTPSPVSPRARLNGHELYWKAIEPLFARKKANGSRRDTSGKQYLADETCAKQWWTDLIWPDGTTDEAGRQRLGATRKLISRAAAKDGPMGWLNKVINKESQSWPCLKLD
tara:strand:- start:2923 stop:3696 length:774 start_codon:yes stop_codon:yes gene_type:complete